MAALGSPVTLRVVKRGDVNGGARFELVDEGDRLVLGIDRERSTAAKLGLSDDHLRYVLPDGSEAATTKGSAFTFPGVPYTDFDKSLSAGTNKSWYNTRCAPTSSELADFPGVFVFDSIEYKIRIDNSNHAKVRQA